MKRVYAIAAREDLNAPHRPATRKFDDGNVERDGLIGDCGNWRTDRDRKDADSIHCIAGTQAYAYGRNSADIAVRD